VKEPFRLSRRAVLRGAGSVAIALPWLEIMRSEKSAMAAPEPARRFLAVYQPGGSVLENYKPTGTEDDFALSTILAPLESVKDRIVVLGGVDMKSASGEQDQAGMIAWLTGTNQTVSPSYGYGQGPSIDQVIAERIAGTRAHASLYMAVRWATGRSHGRIHPINITSFGGTTTSVPRPPLIDPQQIWRDLFGSIGPDENAWDRSILDAVDRRYAALARRLGQADRERLERHLDEVRALEQRLDTIRRCAPPPLVDTAGYDPASGLDSADDGSIRDLPTDNLIPAVGRFMTDMMVMAFACDLTPVGVLQWTDCEAKHTLPWLGLTEHHRYYMNEGGYRVAECTRISTWYSEQHAYLINAMAAVDMGGHSLLDESIVFFGSNIQHPADHTKLDMPFLLAGNGGGLRTGRYLRYERASHNDLLVAILNRFGDTRTTFGTPQYSTGPLPGL
jgi:hypothetical protein